jgi:hypothetical protein
MHCAGNHRHFLAHPVGRRAFLPAKPGSSAYIQKGFHQWAFGRGVFIMKKVLAFVLLGLLGLLLAACVAYPRIATPIGAYQTSPGEWALTFCLGFLYIWLVVTVAVLTFRKGYTALGCLGFFLPILWLIGAILPTKKGSRLWVDQGRQQQADIEQYTR